MKRAVVAALVLIAGCTSEDAPAPPSATAPTALPEPTEPAEQVENRVIGVTAASIRQTPAKKGKWVATLNIGEPVVVLVGQGSGEFAKVRTSDEDVGGYIESKWLTEASALVVALDELHPMQSAEHWYVPCFKEEDALEAGTLLVLQDFASLEEADAVENEIIDVYHQEVTDSSGSPIVKVAGPKGRHHWVLRGLLSAAPHLVAVARAHRVAERMREKGKAAAGDTLEASILEAAPEAKLHARVWWGRAEKAEKKSLVQVTPAARDGSAGETKPGDGGGVQNGSVDSAETDAGGAKSGAAAGLGDEGGAKSDAEAGLGDEGGAKSGAEAGLGDKGGVKSSAEAGLGDKGGVKSGAEAGLGDKGGVKTTAVAVTTADAGEAADPGGAPEPVPVKVTVDAGEVDEPEPDTESDRALAQYQAELTALRTEATLAALEGQWQPVIEHKGGLLLFVGCGGPEHIEIADGELTGASSPIEIESVDGTELTGKTKDGTRATVSMDCIDRKRYRHHVMAVKISNCNWCNDHYAPVAASGDLGVYDAEARGECGR